MGDVMAFTYHADFTSGFSVFSTITRWIAGMLLMLFLAYIVDRPDIAEWEAY